MENNIYANQICGCTNGSCCSNESCNSCRKNVLCDCSCRSIAVLPEMTGNVIADDMLAIYHDGETYKYSATALKNGGSVNIVQTTGNSTTSVMSQKAVTDSIGQAGGGDMMKSIYDTNNNGIVDNSERLGGKLADNYISDNGGEFQDNTVLKVGEGSSIENKNETSGIQFLDNGRLNIFGTSVKINGINEIGDMTKSVYDKNNSGIVDDSERLGGKDAELFVSNEGGSINADLLFDINYGITNFQNAAGVRFPDDNIISIYGNEIRLNNKPIIQSGNGSLFLSNDGTYKSISGGGDMLRSTYDKNNNGVVDKSDDAQAHINETDSVNKLRHEIDLGVNPNIDNLSNGTYRYSTTSTGNPMRQIYYKLIQTSRVVSNTAGSESHQLRYGLQLEERYRNDSTSNQPWSEWTSVSGGNSLPLSGGTMTGNIIMSDGISIGTDGFSSVVDFTNGVLQASANEEVNIYLGDGIDTYMNMSNDSINISGYDGVSIRSSSEGQISISSDDEISIGALTTLYLNGRYGTEIGNPSSGNGDVVVFTPTNKKFYYNNKEVATKDDIVNPISNVQNWFSGSLSTVKDKNGNTISGLGISSVSIARSGNSMHFSGYLLSNNPSQISGITIDSIRFTISDISHNLPSNVAVLGSVMATTQSGTYMGMVGVNSSSSNAITIDLVFDGSEAKGNIGYGINNPIVLSPEEQNIPISGVITFASN